MAVLPGLGGGHLHDLAGSSFQHDKAVFAQSRALHGVSGGRPRIAGLEVQLCIGHACGGWGGVGGCRDEAGVSLKLRQICTAVKSKRV